MMRMALLALGLAVESTAFHYSVHGRIGSAKSGRFGVHSLRTRSGEGVVAARMGAKEGGRRDRLSAREAASSASISQYTDIVTYDCPPGMKVVCDGRNMCVLEEDDDSKPVSSSKLNFWIPRILILGCCMIYGSNFAFGRMLLETAPASVVSGLRFTLAGLALSPFLTRIDRALIKPGLVIGLLLAFGYVGQSIALTTIAAGKVGFFCALSVLVCPILEVLFDGKKMSWGLVGSAMLALVGVGLMELSHGALPGLGDVWALAQPLGFGTAYWLTAKTLRKYPKQTLALTALQTGVVGSVALIWMLGSAWAAGTLVSGAFLAPVLASGSVVVSLLYTGLFTTAFARIGETRALGKLTSSEASILMATEPVWAAVFAALLVSEVVTLSAVQGGTLILLGCVLSTAEKGIAKAAAALKLKLSRGGRWHKKLGRVRGRLGLGGAT